MNLGTLGDVWASFWEPRTAREKLLLTWGGVAVAVVVAYSVLWAPAQQGRSHLHQTLPAMQRQIAQMTAQADEARALASAAQGLAPTGGALRDALSASLTQAGLATTQARLTGEAVQLEAKNASFPAWTMWLDGARKQFKVRVIELHATALKDDGQVDLTVALQPATAPARTEQ
ncbi:type II secretion system protein GspM [Trinickia dinghuensis]|uniref:Type II secretion system protein M n=1 Tax=Trinickia dinghuensis TaxID=2291023 RepID=A0A3D8K0A0_9BURK|nr:type II secretion system protein M [Trinickia dinghuensis]RDU98522.1 type II secretion system protein M [Trinickia dinghuensis]